MPLAGAVLLLWRWVADDQRLQNVLEQRRGRCYEKIILFAMMVRLIADGLLQYAGQATKRTDHLGAGSPRTSGAACPFH
jgi:hypothetical protein